MASDKWIGKLALLPIRNYITKLHTEDEKKIFERDIDKDKSVDTIDLSDDKDEPKKKRREEGQKQEGKERKQKEPIASTSSVPPVKSEVSRKKVIQLNDVCLNDPHRCHTLQLTFELLERFGR